MTEQAVGRGRLLMFASDLDNHWNRFPLNPGVRALGDRNGALPDAGPAPAVRFHAAGRAVRRAGRARRADSRRRKSVRHAGQERRVAVNLDIRESNPARTSVEEFTAGITRLNQVAAGRIQARHESRRTGSGSGRLAWP